MPGQYPKEWTKVFYANWIERIKAEFKKGQLVTLRAIGPAKDQLPFYFRIENIDEVQSFVPWDSQAWAPACILVRTVRGDLYRKVPHVLRGLTEEELRLVILQDTKPQGTA